MTGIFRPKGRDDIAVVARPNQRAKRITLRTDPRVGGFKVSFPPKLPQRKVQEFVDSNLEWLTKNHAPNRSLQYGGSVPFRGGNFVLTETTNSGVAVEGETLAVGGGTERLGATLRGFMRAQAQMFAPPRVNGYADAMGVTVEGLRWRDAKSRWGSCDRNGIIMLNWRLIMAPDWVFDYVIAHEVAHRVHMDHSVAYWSTLTNHFPDAQKARKWLRENGRILQSIDFS